MKELLESFNKGKISRKAYEEGVASRKEEYERDKIWDKKRLMKWQAIDAVEAERKAVEQGGAGQPGKDH
jgi:hypothetical protein